MEGHVTGLHKPYLKQAAEIYNIDLSKYLQMVSEYENEMLKKQNRDYEARK